MTLQPSAVVASLARGRSIAMTAERCHVPTGVVQQLRDNYGPDLSRLEAAAHELAKTVRAESVTPPTPTRPQEFAMTATATAAAPTPRASLGRITAALAVHMDGVTDRHILKLHERALTTLTDFMYALEGHRRVGEINDQIAALEAQLAKARDERTAITGRNTTGPQRAAASPLGPGVAKAVRAWAAANNVDVNAAGPPRKAVVDAWRARDDS